MAYLGMDSPDLYRRAIRSGLAIWYTVDAALGGVAVDGATGLRPTGGSRIVDTTRPGVRRTLNLQLAPTKGLFDLLSPIGTTLTVTGHVRMTSRHVVDIPMGVFVIDDESLTEGDGGGGLSITAPDKWSILQRASFVQPRQSTAGLSVADQIAALIHLVLGGGQVVTQTSTSRAIVGSLTWAESYEKAILELAKGAGIWVYFDRSGDAVIADAPTIGQTADWLIDASASGVLTSINRERSRARTRNVVVLSSSAADGEKFPTQIVWDNDPASPTYAGPDPVNFPAGAGPFGVVPVAVETPLVMDASAAAASARSILHRVAGLASQVSLGSVTNPAIDAGDVLDVLPPAPRRSQVIGHRGGSGFGSAPFGTGSFGLGEGGTPVVRQIADGAVMERHVADTVTTPLVASGSTSQHIDGRSTRTDDYA